MWGSCIPSKLIRRPKPKPEPAQEPPPPEVDIKLDNVLLSLAAQLTRLEKNVAQLKHHARIQDYNMQSIVTRIERLELSCLIPTVPFPPPRRSVEFSDSEPAVPIPPSSL